MDSYKTGFLFWMAYFGAWDGDGMGWPILGWPIFRGHGFSRECVRRPPRFVSNCSCSFRAIAYAPDAPPFWRS